MPAPLTAAALSALPVLLYEAGAHTRRLVDQWAARAGIALKPVMQLGSVEAIKELVGAGLGYGVVPAMAVANAGSRAGLMVSSLTPRLARMLAIVRRRDKKLDRGIQAVIDALMGLAPAT
jgi:DNA-binding transcriptional LysR family regulator